MQKWDCDPEILSYTNYKHKEAFSTLVECLYKWHTFISRILLHIEID